VCPLTTNPPNPLHWVSTGTGPAPQHPQDRPDHTPPKCHNAQIRRYHPRPPCGAAKTG
jgi:hypothetical protein